MSTEPASNPVLTDAEKFYKHDYSESRDYGKLFLTVLSGILAVVAAFSKDIVPSDTLGHARLILFLALVAYLLAIIATTVGLWILYYAGWHAIHNPSAPTYKKRAKLAVVAWIVTAVCFISGNALLVAAVKYGFEA